MTRHRLGRAELGAWHAVAERAWGDSEPEPRLWEHGPWTLELRGDELADIRFDGTLVLRSVRAVARDRDWGTVPAAVTSVEGDAGVLRIALRLSGLGAEIPSTLVVTAAADELAVRFEGRSLTDFDRNRLGLVVLHPPTVAGAPLTVVSPTGARTDTAFPRSISPHQPAFDIARLEWRAAGIAASIDFVGEVFEMEDQRNWTDASFKTYSTPLSEPFPVRIAVGDLVEQSIVLRCERVEDEPPHSAPDAVRFVPTDRRVPAIAIGASTAPDPAPDPARAAPADAVLVEPDTRTGNWRAALARAAADGLPLDVRIVAESAADLPAVLDELVPLRVARLGVFSARSHVTEPELWAALVAGAAERGIRTALLGGARSHFTELNRNHERLPAELPALAFSVTPQMHATERAQLVESIAIQRRVATDAVRIAGGRPVHVGPVTLRSRYNAVATTQAPPIARADLAEGYGAALVADATDPRQGSSALLAWTVASAAALAVPGVASIAYFESWGPRGVASFPVETALDWLHELAGTPLLVHEGELPEGVWAIAGETAAGPVALLANLRSEPVAVRLGTPFDREYTVAPLGAVRLGPESVSR